MYKVVPFEWYSIGVALGTSSFEVASTHILCDLRNSTICLSSLPLGIRFVTFFFNSSSISFSAGFGFSEIFSFPFVLSSLLRNPLSSSLQIWSLIVDFFDLKNYCGHLLPSRLKNRGPCFSVTSTGNLI